jgi:tetratricopeptide (TPR) repeat protein
VEAEDRTAAESFIEPLARLFPSSWEPDYWRGRAALSKGEAPSALFHFAESARKGGSAFPDLGYWNAVALEKSGRAEESARQLEAFLASKPNHLAALEALARLPIAPEKRAQIEGRLPAMRAAQAAVESRIREADAQPLEQAGATTLEAAKLLYAARDPSAFDYYFLGADLVPRDGEAPRRILAGMTSPQDLFVRLHWLRRLLRIDPADPGALGGTATVYLRLGVKLQEAESLAEKLHAAAPSAASYRLRGEIALAQGEQEKARGIFREGLQRFPEDAQLRAAQGKFEATAAPGGDSR